MFSTGMKNSPKAEVPFALGACFFLSSTIFLLFIYRLGSLRIDKGQTPGLRDLGTYFSGGLAILAGEDPYENAYFRIGPTGGLLLGFIAKLFPDYLAATLVMAASVLGFVYFLGTFSGYKKINSFPWVFMGVVIFISAQRENLVNLQISGILALFAAIGFRFLYSRSRLTNLTGISLVAIAIETKPHVLALFVLAVLLSRRKFRSIFGIFVLLLISHLLISIHTDRLITISWLRLLLNLGKKANEGELPERIAFETPFLAIGVSPSTSVIIMLVISLVSATILLFVSRRLDTLHLGLILPSLGIFFHYYDLALGFGLMLSLLYANRHYRLLFLLLGLYLVPQNFDLLPNIILVILLMTVLAFSVFKLDFKRVLSYVGFGVASWSIYALMISVLVSQVDIHELSMSVSILVAIAAGIKMIRDSRSDAIEKSS